jgi:hypothetical protein
MPELIWIHCLSPCGTTFWQVLPSSKASLDMLRDFGYIIIGTYPEKPF